MGYIILTVIVCILFIIYVYIKYNKDATPTEMYEVYREQLDILPAEAGYLINKDCDNADLILSNILTLVNEHYINMELINDDYIFSKTEKTDFTALKPHQMLSYNLFFEDRDEITLTDFFENVKSDQDERRDVEVKYHAIKVALDDEFERMGIIDVNAKRELKRLNMTALELFFIIPLLLIFIFFYDTLGDATGSLNIVLWVIEAFSVILYISTNSDEDKITLLGANLRERALGFKRFLEIYTIMEDKPFYMVNILEYNYTNAIAMGLADTANRRFSKEYVKNI